MIGRVEHDRIGGWRKLADVDAAPAGRDDMNVERAERIEGALHLIDIALLGPRREAKDDERGRIVGAPWKLGWLGVPLQFERRPDVTYFFGAFRRRIAAVDRRKRGHDDEVAVEPQAIDRWQTEIGRAHV